MLFSHSSAVLSDCQLYRYQLTRQWNPELPTVIFIMLNPSVADASIDDPTIRRCRGFAHDWGYGGIRVINLFAWRATKPIELKTAIDPVGPENDKFIAEALVSQPLTIVAWGTSATPARVLELSNLLQTAQVQPYCLGTTQMGHPRHPLYVPRTVQPELYLLPTVA